jgi:arylformamidase
MTIVDLSHVIDPDISVFPGTEKPIFERKEIEGYPEVKITMYTHTATHMDAPIHILKGKKTLDEFTLDKFMGRGMVIDCKEFAGKQIPLSFIEKYENKIKNVEFILLNSGWSKKWKTEEYFSDFPTLTQDAAKWLTKFKLNGIGLDSISLDPVPDLTLPNHKIVLEKEILIIENMCNMDSLKGDEFMFQCFPLKIEKADGSPVRAAAIYN